MYLSKFKWICQEFEMYLCNAGLRKRSGSIRGQCAWVLHCSLVDKWTGTVIKRPPLHPTLPPLCCCDIQCCTTVFLPVLPFCSSDETGLSKWAERNNTYFIREVGTTEDASIWKQGPLHTTIGDGVGAVILGQWSDS